MPFKVKATLVAWKGDTERYPCHHMYEIGDEITFDGEKMDGRICPDMLPRLGELMGAMHVAGPRYVDPGYYFAFWYAPPSVPNPEKAKYDGNGFDPILRTIEEPPFHMRHLQDPKSFNWPPHPERTVAKDVTMFCPDVRTSGLFVFSCYDLADCGQDAPYFRREITMMDRTAKNGGSIEIGDIPSLYDDFERMEIYPPMVKEILQPLLDEICLLDFGTIEDGVFTVTEKGRKRVAKFKAETTPEVIEALKL